MSSNESMADESESLICRKPGAQQSGFSGAVDAEVSDASIKPTVLSCQRSDQAVPKAPSSQPTSETSDSRALASPTGTAGNGSREFRPESGSLAAVMNEMQITPQSSSAPPNLDEQQSDQDIHLDVGQAGAGVGFQPGSGGQHGVLKDLCGQAPGEYNSVIPPQLPASLEEIQRTSPDANWQWRCPTGFQKDFTSPESVDHIMHKTARRYGVRKVANVNQAKQIQLKAILKKLTPRNLDEIVERVKEVKIDNVVTLRGLVLQIHHNALMEPIFCEMYANFCHRLADWLPEFWGDGKIISFKRLLLNVLQMEFEEGGRMQAEANRVEEKGEVEESEEEMQEKKIWARRRKLGNIGLIGELYKKKLLPEIITHSCIRELLGRDEHPEEDIEALCKLMGIIGETIDQPKAKKFMDAHFERMTELSNDMKLSSPGRLMLTDVIALRKNNWQRSRKVEGLKKMGESNMDASQEREAQASSLASSSSIVSSARWGQPLDLGPKAPTVSSSAWHPRLRSNQNRGNQRGGFGTWGGRRGDGHSSENKILAAPLPPRTMADDSVLSGAPMTGTSSDPGDIESTDAGSNGSSCV